MPSPASVSIIIASFNDASRLQVAINSVLSQKVPNLELIVIDGASTDGTIPLLQSYGNCIAFWSSEPDEGIYDAWNKGIALATGDWIGFIGADDCFRPHAIATYQDILSNSSGLDYISSRICLCYGNSSNRLIGQPWSWPKFRHFMNVAHVGSLHHRNLFDKYGTFNPKLRICGDYEFLLRAGGTLRAAFVDDVLLDMASGGVSESSPLSIFESYQVKRSTQSVSTIQATFDCCEALVKWYLRRIMLLLN